MTDVQLNQVNCNTLLCLGYGQSVVIWVSTYSSCWFSCHYWALKCLRRFELTFDVSGAGGTSWRDNCLVWVYTSLISDISSKRWESWRMEPRVCILVSGVPHQFWSAWILASLIYCSADFVSGSCIIAMYARTMYFLSESSIWITPLNQCTATIRSPFMWNSQLGNRVQTMELCIKSRKEGRNRGFDPSLRGFSIESSWVCCVSEKSLDLLLPSHKLWNKIRI